MAVQPTGMKNDDGVIVTIGIETGTDRCAIVLPLATDVTSIGPEVICADAIGAVVVSVFPLLVPCLSSTANIRFVAGEGMIDDRVPYRIDYSVSDHPGTGGDDPIPSQAAGLIVFYEDPEDNTGGGRMLCGKNFIPGLPNDEVVAANVISTMVTKLNTLAALLQTGFPTGTVSGQNWYRVLATPKPRTSGTIVKRTITSMARGYVCTQKRRLIPR